MTIDRRWSILGVLFLARTAMGFQFQSVASSAPFLIADLHVGFATIGTLIGLYMLPGIVIAFPGGLLSRRFGDKALCVTGLGLMIAGGVIMSFGPSLAPILVGRVVSGTGSVLFNLVVTKMVTDWFAGREIVLAMAVILATWPFGIAAGLLIQPILAASHGWPSVMLATAALCSVSLLLIALFYRAPSRTASASSVSTSVPMLPPLREMLPSLVAGAMWGNLNLALVIFFSFTPALLTGFGLPSVTAAAWTGAGLWIVMIGLPLAGIIVQRSGKPDAAIVIFAVFGAAILALLPSGFVPLALCAAFGVAMCPPAGPIMALPSRVLSPEHRAGGLGLFFTVYYIAMTVGPAAAGLVRQVFDTPAAALLMAAALFAFIVPLMGLFRMFAANRLGAALVS